jgi:hypothetical protein
MAKPVTHEDQCRAIAMYRIGKMDPILCGAVTDRGHWRGGMLSQGGSARRLDPRGTFSETRDHSSPQHEISDNDAHSDDDCDNSNVDPDTPQMNGALRNVQAAQQVDQEFFGDKTGQQKDRTTDRGVSDVLAGQLPQVCGFVRHLGFPGQPKTIFCNHAREPRTKGELFCRGAINPALFLPLRVTGNAAASPARTKEWDRVNLDMVVRAAILRYQFR